MENRIKQTRKEKGLTQQELADELSVTRQYISLLERGEAQATISVAMEIANKLNTCVYTLFGFDRFECEQCHEGVGGN
ncbi:MAG: helix-turn-helix domain-containing protein [Peptoniphilus harei]|nr:helix-turn-helix domain-containing protein [Peptoniphilus harei]MDU5807516.1 helix-turn-helix domain-containing protein [Peptoniphilus harei]